ncbi:extracellular electron transfer flavoprotein PplA [Bacillus kwashiorkori]|uniref:extracellular electron transfer flavoprotein PplA n=1 Tax=Bacillus kwashiorkori TaxID=1522318 RepID=UPI0007803190|nr:extracellular electron transfer flavoprotein PplA [Bacillus kwashiorkori]
MKSKWLSIMVIFFVLLLAACGGNDDKGKDNNTDKKDPDNAAKTEQTDKKIVAGAPLQDGVYTLTENDFDENGWKVNFRITVDKGKITKSEYDYVNADGKLKSEDENYDKAMREKTGTGPKDYIPDLNKQLEEKQDAKQVDVVTGATHSSENFINYAQQLMQAAQKGNTTPIEIANTSPLKDGVYKLTEKNLDANGWKTYLNITVEGGKITQVDYNNLNAEGKLKTDDEGYQKAMSEKVNIGPKEYIPRLSEALVEKQDPLAISVISGATHSTHTFKLYAQQLINAAQKGDQTPIEVDNIVFEK